MRLQQTRGLVEPRRIPLGLNPAKVIAVALPSCYRLGQRNLPPVGHKVASACPRRLAAEKKTQGTNFSQAKYIAYLKE
ncbi:hypothetical protein EYF80_017313 [Liparis tanakae]|uniref:Uncharacterized protein n=1 Tax=Liparis tanakae TaxID=230148 RepID=A0A4Z2I3H8_9TELE|nr:hypothetical protein EYF80_017313 [Liparis tanakae]